MAVVTTDEFSSFLGGWNFDSTQRTSAEAILDGVQSELERYLNRPLQQRRVLEKIRPETWDGKAFLEVTPLVAVHGAYYFGEFESQGPAVKDDFTLQWLPGTNYVRVATACYLDYTAGMNGDVNPGVKLAIMRVARREWPHNHDSGTSVRGTEARPSAEGGAPQPGWREEELKAFDRLRRRVVL